MANSFPTASHHHRTSWFIAAAAIGLLTSPFAAVWTSALGLAGALLAAAAARGRMEGPAGAVVIVAAGLVAGAFPYLLLGLLQSGSVLPDG
jgi:hypothetical protein